ncbi:MAG TPA: competence/damage-inducible protein A [Candidatus Baltobacteraceae bacterium]|nr:competence/damage-inducible protein A [Candidatus Baltobacteraceae bacterium]
MPLSVELIAVGTELLLGQQTDTNSVFIAQSLAANGIDVYGTHAVGDNRARIASAMRGALERVTGVITTGGLGPTIDDVTKEAVCDALGLDVELNEPSLKQMQEFFAQIGREMRENNRKQAYVPRGSLVLENPRGTAPGFVAFGEDGKFIACMPGVPREMRPMLTDLLIPFLRERYAVREAIYTRVLHTVNIGESEIDHRIDDLFRASENPKIAVLAHEGLCDVKIMAKTDSQDLADTMIAQLETEIRGRLDGFIFGADDLTLQGAVHELLRARAATIAVAESCTGGRIAAALTAVPGSSQSFLGGIVAYDNAVKVEQLGVSGRTLERYGAVSEETVGEMARGVRERLHTNYGLSTTGIAGPDGGSDEKPVGLVWFAIDAEGESKTYRFHFRGDRDAVQRRATVMALGLVWRFLSLSR